MPKKNSLEVSSFQKILALTGLVTFTNFFLFRSFTPMAASLQLAGWIVYILFVYLHRSNLSAYKWFIPAVLGWVLIQTAAVAVIGSGVGMAVAVLSLLIVGVITAYVLASGIPFVRSLMELLLSPAIMALEYLKAGLRTARLTSSNETRQKVTSSKLSNAMSASKSVIVGVVIGLPLVAILISMLTSADPIFAKFIANVFGGVFLKELPSRLFASLLIAGVAGVFFNLKRSDRFHSPLAFTKHFNAIHEVTVALAMVAITVGIFLVVQWPYVFVKVARETELSQYGVATYSEYVKKGFSELTKAAIFLFGLAWMGLVVLRDHRHKVQKTWLPAVQLVILAEFMIFQLSILRRVWLYQAFHGWTLAKIYGGIFLLALIGMTLTLALRHLWVKRWVLVEAVILGTFILAVTWFNAEAFIVNSGHVPTVNEQKDYMYLARMSPDGYVGWQQSYGWAQQILLNSGYQDKTTLDDHDRRQIAYAGRVVKALSKNSLELHTKHANADQYRAFYTAVLNQELQEAEQRNVQIKSVRDRLDERLANMKDNAPQSTYEAWVKVLRRGDEELAKSQERLAQLRDAHQKVRDTSVPITELPNFYLDTNDQFHFTRENVATICDDTDNLLGDLCQETRQDFFSIQDYRKINPGYIHGRREALLRYNQSEIMAMERLDQDMPIDELLKLHQAYFNLRRKIMTQPEDQRGYPEDVNLNSPFVD